MAESQTTSFTVFPKLPPELRNEIWVMAALEPRIYKIIERKYNMSRYLPNSESTQRRENSLQLQKTGATARECMTAEERLEPGVLFACWESHKETKHFFDLVYEKLAPSSSDGFAYKWAALFINFEVDRFLLLPRDNAVHTPPCLSNFNFSHEILFRIQHLEQNFSVQREDTRYLMQGLVYILVKASCNVSRSRTHVALKDFTIRLITSSAQYGSDPNYYSRARLKADEQSRNRFEVWYKKNFTRGKLPVHVKAVLEIETGTGNDQKRVLDQ